MVEVGVMDDPAQHPSKTAAKERGSRPARGREIIITIIGVPLLIIAQVALWVIGSMILVILIGLLVYVIQYLAHVEIIAHYLSNGKTSLYDMIHYFFPKFSPR
jgi:hypothetical protein